MDLYLISDIKDDTSNIEKFIKMYTLSNIDNRIIQDNNVANNLVSNLGCILCKSTENTRILICTQNKIQEDVYFKLLNAAFTAKRFNIRIDCLSIVNNPILRQCTIITKGLYIKNTLKGLISLLSNKQSLNVMSFNVKCICYKQDVLVGLTCPVCLGVYCRFVPVCKRCKTKFNFIKL